MDISSAPPPSGEGSGSVGAESEVVMNEKFSTPPATVSGSGGDESEVVLNVNLPPLPGAGSGSVGAEVEAVVNEKTPVPQPGTGSGSGGDEIEVVMDEKLPPPPPPPGTGSGSGRGESEDLVPRIYERWRGNNTFILQGRIIFGPRLEGLFVTISLVVAPAVVFCAIVARKLMDDFPNHTGISIMVFAVALTLFDLIILLVVSGSDPGIIPRYKQLPGLPLGHGYDAPSINVNGIDVELKFCRTCKVYRPPRASHCQVCNNCIQNFDHHCPWMSQCVGRQNYGLFYMFIITTALLSGYLFGFSWVYLVRVKNSEHRTIWKTWEKSLPTFFLTIYTFIEFAVLSAFCLFHTYLISINQTTYEFVKKQFKNSVNPHDMGVFINFAERLFPSPLTKINFRERVEIKTPPPIDPYVGEKITRAILDSVLQIAGQDVEPTREDVAIETIGEDVAIEAIGEDVEPARKAACIEAGHVSTMTDLESGIGK